MANKEEILVEDQLNKHGERLYPVKLLTYKCGGMDLHCQTGDNHKTMVDNAKAILWKRGLAVGPAEMIGPTGCYYPVVKFDKDQLKEK